MKLGSTASSQTIESSQPERSPGVQLSQTMELTSGRYDRCSSPGLMISSPGSHAKGKVNIYHEACERILILYIYTC